MNKQVRETITKIWTDYNCGFKKGNNSGVVESCFDSGNILNMEMTGHVNTLNTGHEQMRRVQDDTKLFGLNNWKDRIVVIRDGDTYKHDKFGGEDWEVFSGHVNFEVPTKYPS